jgi:hypothetical protein
MGESFGILLVYSAISIIVFIAGVIILVYDHFKERRDVVVKECDHTYFPKYEAMHGHVIGQQCSICGKFNSLEDMGLRLEHFQRPDRDV